MDEAPALCQAALRKGCSDLCGTPDCCWWPHVPKGLDLVGFDMYRDTGVAEVAAVKAYAEACVFPMMHSAQGFVTVVALPSVTTRPQRQWWSEKMPPSLTWLARTPLGWSPTLVLAE